MIPFIQTNHGFILISKSLSQKKSKYKINLFFYIILIFFHQKSTALEICMKKNQEIATKALTQVSEYAAPACEVLSWVGLTTQLYSVAVDVKSYFLPNNQEQFKNEILQKEMKYIVTQRNFKNCILTHKFSHEIDSSGYPTSCKETIRTFKMCGGTSEIDATKVMFNKIRKEQN